MPFLVSESAGIDSVQIRISSFKSLRFLQNIIFQSPWQDQAKDLILLRMIKEDFRTTVLTLLLGYQGTDALAVSTALCCLVVVWLNYSRPLSNEQCLWNMKILKLCSCSSLKQAMVIAILWVDSCLRSYFFSVVVKFHRTEGQTSIT